MEIRAVSLHAIELLVAKINETSEIKLNSVIVDNLIWEYAMKTFFGRDDDLPHHRTRTIFYWKNKCDYIPYSKAKKYRHTMQSNTPPSGQALQISRLEEIWRIFSLINFIHDRPERNSLTEQDV